MKKRRFPRESSFHTDKQKKLAYGKKRKRAPSEREGIDKDADEMKGVVKRGGIEKDEG